jgi:hypothetical protein
MSGPKTVERGSRPPVQLVLVEPEQGVPGSDVRPQVS